MDPTCHNADAMMTFHGSFLVSNLVQARRNGRKEPGLDPGWYLGGHCAAWHTSRSSSDWWPAPFFLSCNGVLRWTNKALPPAREHLPYRRSLWFPHPILQRLFCNVRHTGADLRGLRSQQVGESGVTEYVGHLSCQQLLSSDIMNKHTWNCQSKNISIHPAAQNWACEGGKVPHYHFTGDLCARFKGKSS